MTPDDVEAIAAQLYVEMLEAGFAAVAEFHYLHNAPDGAPYAAPAELAARIVAAAAGDGDRPDAAAGLLRPRDLRRRAAPSRAAPLRHRPRRFRPPRRRLPRLMRGCRAASASRRIRCAPSRRTSSPRSSRWPATAPIHIHVAEQIKEVEDCLAWSGARPVDGCSTMRRSTGAGACVHATHMNDGETRAPRALGRGRRPVPGHRGQPRRRRLQRAALSRRRRRLRRRLGFQRPDRRRRRTAAARIRPAAARRAPAISSRRGGGSTGRALYDGALAGGAQALSATERRAAPRPDGRPGQPAHRPSAARRPLRRRNSRHLDLRGRQSGGRLRVERRAEGGRRRTPSKRASSIAARSAAVMRRLASA